MIRSPGDFGSDSATIESVLASLNSSEQRKLLSLIEEDWRRQPRASDQSQARFLPWEPDKPPIERLNGQLTYRLHPHQLAGHELAQLFTIVALAGSIRNGKSRWAFTQGVDLIVNRPLPPPNIPRVVWTVLPTRTPYYDSIRPEFETVMGWANEGGLILDKHETKSTYFLRAKDGKAPWEWVFMSGEDPDGLRTATIAAAHLTEAGKMEEQCFVNVMGRLVASNGPCWIESSPWGLDWVWRTILERATLQLDFRTPVPEMSKRVDGDSRIGVVRGVPIEANKALPAQAVKALRDNASVETQRKEYDGEHFASSGLVLNGFNPKLHITKEVGLELFIKGKVKWAVIAGHDFGFGHPEAHIFVVTDGWRYWVVDEYREPSLTFDVHADRIKAFLWAKHTLWTYGDPSAAQAHAEYMTYGIAMSEADNDVELGINKLNQLFQSGRLKISAKCKMLIGEMGKWMRNPKTGKPGLLGEDLCAALRYCIYTHALHNDGNDNAYGMPAADAPGRMVVVENGKERVLNMGAGDGETGAIEEDGTAREVV